MPQSGHRKSSKQNIESLIAEILIENPSEEYRDIDYKLRSDPIWRDRLSSGVKIPKLGTIKNYVSKVRSALRSTGSDRPWSVLASSDPDNHDFIPANDLPLVLKIWSIRLAHGQALTLRHARWISRLRYLVDLDESNDQQLRDLFHMASKYAGRAATLGDKNSPNERPVDSHDLDAELFALFSKVEDDDERDPRRLAYGVGQSLGLFTLPLSDPTQPKKWIVSTERTAIIFSEVESLSAKAANLIGYLDLSSSSVLFLVLELVFRGTGWKTKNDLSRRSNIEEIVDLVVAKNWERLAIKINVYVPGLNDEYWLNYEDESETDE